MTTDPNLPWTVVAAQRDEAVWGLERIRDNAGRSGFSSMVAAEYHLARIAELGKAAPVSHTHVGVAP